MGFKKYKSNNYAVMVLPDEKLSGEMKEEYDELIEEYDEETERQKMEDNPYYFGKGQYGGLIMSDDDLTTVVGVGPVFRKVVPSLIVVSLITENLERLVNSGKFKREPYYIDGLDS